MLLVQKKKERSPLACTLKKRWLYLAAPLFVILMLCGCAKMEKIEPYPPQTNIILPQDTAQTTTQTTVETTTATTNVYTPPEDAVIVSVLDNMTLREKVSQMMLVSCLDEDLARSYAARGAGGLCLFAKPFEGKTPEQVRNMTASFQNAARYPMLIAVDEEGGTVNRVSINPLLREKKFQSPKEVYEAGGWGQVRTDTEDKANFLLNLGINANLAPVCDVPQSNWDYIAPRSFGLDASDTASYIMAVVTAMRNKRLGSTLKHFPGYGGSGDTHQNIAYDNRDYQTFLDRDFKPFRAGIDAGADSVMVSHNIVKCMDPDQPASLSPEVHRILREELQFRGVIISDDLGMNAITKFTNGENPAVAAVKAGNDLLCYSDFDSAVEAVVAAVEAGEIEQSQIDASVLRILYWKRTIGILK